MIWRRLLAGLLSLCAVLANATELRLTGAEARVPLAPFVEVFEDKSAALGIEEVVRTGRFATQPELLRPGHVHSAIWLRFNVVNVSARRIPTRLEVPAAGVREASMFQRLDGQWQRNEGGTDQPIFSRAIVTPNTVFPIFLAAHEQRTVYLRLAGPLPIAIAPILWEPLAFRTNESRIRLLDGAMLGGLVVMALLGLFLLAIFQDRAFLFNVLATATYFFGELSAKGYSFMYLWPNAPDWAMRSMPMYALLGAGLNILFLRDLLLTRSNFPRIDRLLLVLLAIEWLPAPGVLFGELEVWANLSFPLHFPITVVMALVGIYAASTGIRAARFYTAAYVTLALGSLVHGLTQGGFDVLPDVGRYALPVSMLVSNLFLLASVIDRVMTVHREKEAAQSALLAFQATHEAELELAVTNRTAELNAALVETRQSNQTKALLLAYISHDLRAPLATIMSCIRRLGQHDNLEMRRHQTTIERSAAHQLELIDDLVDYARGEFDCLELVPEPTFLCDWLDNIAGQAQLLASKGGNHFLLETSRDLPPVVVVDAKRLRQVVINLLANAAKFTSDGEVRLCLQIVSRTDDKVTLEFAVEDTGKGIPADDMERIFQPFERRQSSHHGSGLGLSIARPIVRAMGGDLSVASTLNVGSRFAFRLALVIADESAVPLPTQVLTFPEPFGAGQSLLIADDTETSREYLREVLGTADFDIVCAHDGVEALQMATKFRFDLILVDQIMPDMSGWDVLRRLHELRTGAVPPIILCSAMRAERPEGFPAGIDFTGTLLKPISPEKLLQTVREALRGHTLPAPLPPPEAMLAPLRVLIDGGNISEIEQWSTAIAADHPEYAAFAAAIEDAAVQINFTMLKALTSSSAVA